MSRALHLSDNDDVAVLIEQAEPDMTACACVRDVITVGHEIAARPAVGRDGPEIRAVDLRGSRPMAAGEHVHRHNPVVGKRVCLGPAEYRDHRRADRGGVVRSPLDRAGNRIYLACNVTSPDGWAGILANSALGTASDLLVAAGGTVLLSETPEIYGAEHLLMARAATADIAQALEARIRWWENYAGRNGASRDNNSWPGNKAGGLTTIFKKSLGTIAKAGASPLNGVALR